MKRTIFFLSLLLGTSPLPHAQEIDGVTVGNLKMDRNGEYLVVEMDVELSRLEVEANRAVLLTPRLVNGADSADLPAVGIYGRRRYYYYVRNGASMLSGDGETSFKAAEKPERVAYHVIVPYDGWMNGATLRLSRRDYGCCNTMLAAQQGLLGHFEEPVPYTPRPVYVRPTAEAVKSRSLSGSAFIDFPVNKTVIYHDYRRNTAELGNIEATIDSVRNDRDVTITSVWLKGYASPESPWTHNRMLAIGRTEALKKHIRQLYRFDEGVIETDYEPEDWAGLRSYVECSNLTHRAEILALIDSSLEPDAKEAKIKRSYSEEYDFLLKNRYPALCHTDYRITYTIRTFSDAQEIRHIMLTQPQKLSLNEFYLPAQACSPGSDEFNETFETAVRMYPEDTAANLNAANTAMQKGDLKNAEHYLRKAGESPEALYARGAYAMLTEEYETAAGYLQEAEKAGIRETREALEQLQKRNKK